MNKKLKIMLCLLLSLASFSLFATSAEQYAIQLKSMEYKGDQCFITLSNETVWECFPKQCERAILNEWSIGDSIEIDMDFRSEKFVLADTDNEVLFAIRANLKEESTANLPTVVSIEEIEDFDSYLTLSDGSKWQVWTLWVRDWCVGDAVFIMCTTDYDGDLDFTLVNKDAFRFEYFDDAFIFPDLVE